MSVIHPRAKEKVTPAYLDGKPLPVAECGDPRMKLAQWIVAHPYFAEATSNRIWGYFFGRGIVDPVDDFRSTNPPSHPELLEALAKDLRDHKYDWRLEVTVQVGSATRAATPKRLLACGDN